MGSSQLSMVFAKWRLGLEQRLSRKDAMLHLGLRNLYIFPSGLGGLWLLVCAITYWLGINSRSNIVLILAFLMLTLLALSLFATHFNLQGLTIQALPQTVGFTGEKMAYQITSSSSIWRPCLYWRWLHNDQAQQRLDLAPGRHHHALIWCGRRPGKQMPGRLLVHTTAPLGLFRCWAYWEPPEAIWLAPAPLPGPVLESTVPCHGARAQRAQAITQTNGSEVLEGLKPWRQGEGLQRLAWKTTTRGKTWQSKDFSGLETSPIWLAPMPQLELEKALGHVCHRLCQVVEDGQAIGLNLPNGISIQPGHGARHREQCLKALAEQLRCP